MADVSQSESFWLTWKVENIHLSNLKMQEEISTPVFKVGILQNTMWQLRLAPAGIDDPLYMGCTLARMSSEREQYEPEHIQLEWKVNIIGEGGSVRFEKWFESLLRRQECVIVPRFIRKSELLSTDMHQNNLTIYCRMTNDSRFSAKQDLAYDLEALSSGLASLLESGFRSDFTMICEGKIFNVHKYILLSRWPGFCERFEIDEISNLQYIDVSGIQASTLKTFLTFLYSGKMQHKDISMELCTYMHEHFCDILMASIETPVSDLEFVTHMRYEWKHLTWEVGDDNVWKMCKTPFFRVIPLEEVYPAEMVLTFSFEERNGEEWLKLGVEFTGFNALQPLLLAGEISFRDKGEIAQSCKFNRLLETRDVWYFPPFVKKCDLLPNKKNSKCIEISLRICDGSLPTRQVSASIENASRFREVRDLSKLMIDLATSSYERDLKLKIGDQWYNVHSLLLAARSAKFRKLIEDSYGIIEMEECMSEKASRSFIRYFYGDRLLDLDNETITMLNTVAKKYSLPSLEEKTRRMLEGQVI